MSKLKVLIVDDDTSILLVLKTILTRLEFEVKTADSSDKGLNLLRHESFDLMLSDIVMQPFDGITLLRQARTINPNTQIIMMTGYATIETATEALKLGAFDYVCKPFKIEELNSTIQRAVSYIHKLSGVKDETPQKENKLTLIKKYFKDIVGDCPIMKERYDQLPSLLASTDPILITGASGTGKSLIAKILHQQGKRAEAPFATLNCAIIPESHLETLLFGYVTQPTDEHGNVIKGLPIVKKGILETNAGGTVCIEEISAMPKMIQDKLVKVIIDGKIQRIGSDKDLPFDVHIIADTSHPLEAKVKKGQFLSTLYSLINYKHITLPALKDREKDWQLLLQYFLIQYNNEAHTNVSCDSKVTAVIAKYSWPGNVRELKSLVFRAASQCRDNKIHLSDLPVPVRMCYMRDKSSAFSYSDEIDLRWWSLKTFIKNKEIEYVNQVLNATKGDKAKAAQLMGISVADFYKKYGNIN